MPECPILMKEIDIKECRTICIEADKEGKEKMIIPKKIKRIIGWRGICRSCKNHKKE